MRLDDYAAKITDFVASGSFASLRENVHYYKEENYAILVRTADFGSNFQKDLVYLDKQGYDFLSNSNLVGGELILPNIGASIGKVFIVPQLHKPMTLGPNSILIRTYIEEMTKYLYFVFSSSWGFDLLHDISSATAQGKFNKTDLKNIFLPIPPIEEQRRIIQSINLWLAQIDNIDANKADLLYAIQQTRYKVLDLALHGQLVSQDPNDEPAIELLKRINPTIKPCDTSHYGNLPKGWCVVKLGDIGKWQAGGTPNRSVKEYYGGNIPWLKTGDLNDGFINEIPECITQAGLDNSSAKLNPKDSVLIAMYGATIGKIGILTFPAATNQACCACVDYPVLEKLYLFYFLLSHRDAFIKQGGGGAQPNISKEIILNTEIPLPPINEQKRIAEMITEVFSFLDKISADL